MSNHCFTPKTNIILYGNCDLKNFNVKALRDFLLIPKYVRIYPNEHCFSVLINNMAIESVLISNT